MQKKPGDQFLGALIVCAVALALGLLWGLPALLTVGLVCLDAALALHLWRKQSLWAKALAVVLLPMLLLEPLFRPQTLKQSLARAGRMPKP